MNSRMKRRCARRAEIEAFAEEVRRAPRVRAFSVVFGLPDALVKWCGIPAPAGDRRFKAARAAFALGGPEAVFSLLGLKDHLDWEDPG